MMGFRQVETKQVQEGNDQVKLSGDAQIEGKIGDHIANQLGRIGYVLRGNHKVIVDNPIQDEMDHSPEHPLQPFLINLILVVVVVGSAKCAVIYYWKERK